VSAVNRVQAYCEPVAKILGGIGIAGVTGNGWGTFFGAGCACAGYSYGQHCAKDFPRD